MALATADFAESGLKQRRFAARALCHRWRPNQFRLLLASLACTLLNTIRPRLLKIAP